MRENQIWDNKTVSMRGVAKNYCKANECGNPTNACTTLAAHRPIALLRFASSIRIAWIKFVLNCSDQVFEMHLEIDEEPIRWFVRISERASFSFTCLFTKLCLQYEVLTGTFK